MKTEKRFELSYEPITYRGEYRGVLRGLWRMEGDKMGARSSAMPCSTRKRAGYRSGKLCLCPESKRRT